jgi:SAM-dependent methyltransferase
MIAKGSEGCSGGSEFDDFAEAYDKALNQGLKFTGESKEYFALERVEWVVSRLGSPAAGVERVLDFGCGTGTSSAMLRGAFPTASYWGFDPSMASVKVAQGVAESGGARFTAEVAELPVGRFDLAFTNGVFHHIPVDQRAEAVALVWRSLKPGGWFAFWENNRWNPMVHFMMSRVPFDRDAQMLFPFQARALLRAAGFQVVCRDFLFVFPAALKALRWLEPGLCKLPFGGQYLILARKPDAPVTVPL